MLRLAPNLASKVRLLNNTFQLVCCTWSRPYFCSSENWILKYGKYSECDAALSKSLITELLKERYTIDAVANLDSLCHGVCIAIDAVESYLKSRTQKITTFEEIAQIAAIAACGDREIGEIIAKARKTVAARAEFLIHVLHNLLILIHEKKISNDDVIKQAMEQAPEIGGASEVEVKEKKDRVDRVEKAVRASSTAMKNGVFPGDVAALLHASKELDNLQTTNSHEKIGIQLHQNALKVVSPKSKFVPAMRHRLVSSVSLAHNFSSKSQGNVLGIDLGTTYSRVAVMEGEDPVVIEEVEGGEYNKKSFRSVPSVVFFKPNGELWVGRLANMMTSLYPSRTLFDTKHLVGTMYDGGSVQTTPYPKIVKGFKGEAWIETQLGIYSPAKIQAYILARMRTIAEAYLEESTAKAVITVPAYFNEAQSEAIKYAGGIAGLDVQGVVKDPVAAALTYGLDKRDGLFAVYSFGGTFEFSILEISNGVIKVKAESKSLSHGGLSFDLLLVQHLWKEFERFHAFDASRHRFVPQRFLGAAQSAKVRLSSEPQVEVKLHNLLNIQVNNSFVRKDLEVTILRSEFESMVSELIKGTGTICQECLEVTNITTEDIDDILVVGGLGCVPSVREYVELFFGKSPLKSPSGVTPDEAVVIGAAIHGKKFR